MSSAMVAEYKGKMVDECWLVLIIVNTFAIIMRVIDEKKMYSIRLKVKTVDAIKKKAAEAGIPYQTYVNVLLDNAAFA